MPDWDEIVDRDGKAVWQAVYRILGNAADADECFQEAFLAAWEVSRREQVQNWRALLLRLGAARAVDRLRQRHRRTRGQLKTKWESLPGHEPPPSQSTDEAELTERLRVALACLPVKQAEVFCLHCVEGWHYQEIAKHLALSVSSVGVLIYRARKRLRRLLEMSHEFPRSPGRESTSGSGPVSHRRELL
jgi:RNA polymerase sigma-70 factor (ECF subfamily)